MLNFPQLPTTHSPFKVFACACIIILLIELSPSPADAIPSCTPASPLIFPLSYILFFCGGGDFFPYSACSSLPLPLPLLPSSSAL